MAKGYWIASVTVHDMDAYKRYVEADTGPVVEHGGKFLVRGGQCESMEGDTKTRNVVVEFPSFEAAKTCYDSRAYQAAKTFRDGAADFNLVIVEGYEG